MNRRNLVLFNILVLYGRLTFSAIAILVSTRIILQELGTEDYGLYNLLAGVISMLSFLNAAMSVATQRFLSYSLGEKKNTGIIFYYSIVLHCLIAFFVILIIELIGQFCLIPFLNIPLDRLTLSSIIIHFLCINIFFTIIAVPYDALLNAHENMLAIAIIGCIESALKLLVAYIIIADNGGIDKLLLFSILMCLIPGVSFVLKLIYVRLKYIEACCKIAKISDYDLFKSLFSFAGWNLIGASSTIVRGQGYAILFNVFGSVSVNASYGIANQVNSQVSFFSDTIVKALRPQIVISEGEGNRDRMLRLSNIASKFPFFLLLMVSMPLLIDTSFIMSLWLKEVPNYAVEMVQITLITTLFVLMTKGTQISIEAVGIIKNLQIFVGGLHFFAIPLGWILLYCGYDYYWALYGILLEEVIATFIRIWIASKTAGLRISDFVVNVLFRNMIVFVILLLGGYFIFHALNEGYLRFILLTCSSIILTTVVGYYIGLVSTEKKIIKNTCINIFNKFRK